MSAFDFAFTRTVGHEGGLSLDRNDRGNWTSGVIGQGELRGTKYGIASHAYPTLDIRGLTIEQAKAIYRRDYWDRIKADQLPAALAVDVFDAAVNMGVSQATRMMQRALGVTADGLIGPQTIAAAGAANPERFRRLFAAEWLGFYTDLPGWPHFGKGWVRRVAANLKG